MTNSSGKRTTLVKPDALDFDHDEEEDEQTESPDSSDPDSSNRDGFSVLPLIDPNILSADNLPRRTRSLTTYHDASRRGATPLTHVFVSDEFVNLDYSAVQTLKSVERSHCSVHKLVFSVVLTVVVLSFFVTLLVFVRSLLYPYHKVDWWNNQAYPAGCVFLVLSLIVILSHVLLPRSYQVRYCASHITNVLTRNRYAVVLVYFFFQVDFSCLFSVDHSSTTPTPSFFSMYTSRSRSPKGKCQQYVVLFCFALLLIADLGATMFLLLIYGTVQDKSSPACQQTQGTCPTDFSAFTFVVGIYPFAYIVSPVIGLMSLLFWLPFWIKRFVEWNLGSILSACASVAAYLWFYDDLVQNQLGVATAQVAVKFALAILAQVHLASMLKQFDNNRRRRLRSAQGDRFTAGSVLDAPFF